MVQQSGWSATTLHSDKTQTQREAALQQLRDGEVQALVATDVAGRGLDVPDVCKCCYQALPSQQTPTTFSPSSCSKFPLPCHIPDLFCPLPPISISSIIPLNITSDTMAFMAPETKLRLPRSFCFTLPLILVLPLFSWGSADF